MSQILQILDLLENKEYENDQKNIKLIIDYFNNITIIGYNKLYNKNEIIIDDFLDYIEEYQIMNDINIEMPIVVKYLTLCNFLLFRVRHVKCYPNVDEKKKLIKVFNHSMIGVLLKASPQSIALYFKNFDMPVDEIVKYLNESYISTILRICMKNIYLKKKIIYNNLEEFLNYDFWIKTINESSGYNWDFLPVWSLYDINTFDENYSSRKKRLLKRIRRKYNYENYTISLEEYTKQYTDLLKPLEDDILKKKSQDLEKSRIQMFKDFEEIIDDYDGHKKKVHLELSSLYKNESKTTFELHLKKLFNIYSNELSMLKEWCSGCGKRGQNQIDNCYDKLILLKEINDKDFSQKLDLPIKPSISNDGFVGGLCTGFSMFR